MSAGEANTEFLDQVYVWRSGDQYYYADTAGVAAIDAEPGKRYRIAYPDRTEEIIATNRGDGGSYIRGAIKVED